LQSIETSSVAMAATKVYHFSVAAEGQEIAPPSSRLASSSIQPAPKYFKRNYCPEMDFLYRVGGHM
jgi:hypothetical protein